ncbi:hypothetical protein ILUMI_13093 [Ignelater luminosus]|uniref:Uncharacterized protein n=1 Tax=Ignelater luminosus TaxID=2038154 RepID=A0A8K0CXA6_IGNLU|nr:hypothetical protein ILUMI_13093 [Ignelater luminosus]
MYGKAVLGLLVLGVVAVYGQGGGDHHHHHHLEEYIDYQAHPHYHYDYHVHDLKHHDVKSQWETRDGHHTKGVYTLIQPDHKKRIVEYEADKHGVRYTVKFEGHGHHGGGN